MKHIGFLLLLLSGMALAACSSDDDESVESSNGRKLRQLTIAEVPVTKDAPTSKKVKITDNSSSLDASWTKDDMVTYFNVSSLSQVDMDYGKLTAASSTSTSMFQGSVNLTLMDVGASLVTGTSAIVSWRSFLPLLFSTSSSSSEEQAANVMHDNRSKRKLVCFIILCL